MKLFKTFLLATITFFSGLTLWGQKTNEIVCNLQVEIVPYNLIKDSTIFSMYGNICKITQSFQIQRSNKDTICFVLDNPSQFSFSTHSTFKNYIKEKH